MTEFIQFFLHIDVHLQNAIVQFGPTIYVLLFIIIFCETGLVITPFLPGDSLLFAVGTFAALGDLNLGMLWILLTIAAIGGDSLNYSLGKVIGERIFTPNARILKRAHLEKTHAFFAKYGRKAIVLARFVPILRTFVPFVAGAGSMEYRSFFAFNVIGGVVWVTGFLLLGYFFGTIPVVKANFEFVILGIVVISILPAVIEWWRARRASPPSSPR